MRRALDLAEEAAGGLAPRPAVGAVIVAADGDTVVGEGATQPSPGPHAEAVAIAAAKEAARNGTIYCTLEPHQFHSTTPPCSQAIVDAGIKRVVCPVVDPNPQVQGHGFDHLRSAGIEVVTAVNDDETQKRATELIEGFAKHVTTGLPFVTVKWAMSLDGKIATRNGDSKWISNESARNHAHHIRYRSDAVMTGIGTVIADDPRLTARHPKTGERMAGRPYLRVVVDSRGRLSKGANLLKEEGHIIQAVATDGIANDRCIVLNIPGEDGESVDLFALLRALGKRGCMNILVEAGQKLTGRLFDLNLVDKVIAYVATSKVIGGIEALSPVGGQGTSIMTQCVRLRDTRIEHLGGDIAIIGYIDHRGDDNRCSAA